MQVPHPQCKKQTAVHFYSYIYASTGAAVLDLIFQRRISKTTNVPPCSCI